MKLLSLLFLVTLLASSCSQKSETVAAKMDFVLGASVTANTVGGMLWGKNLTKNTGFGQAINPGVPFEKELEHGQWTFWVITWSGNQSNEPMTGLTRCDSKTINLDATTPNLDVSFTLSNSKCNQGFGQTDSVTTTNNTVLYFFPNFSFNNCKNLNSSTSATDQCNLTNSNQGYFSSYRLSFPSFEGTQFNSGMGQTSVCFNNNNYTNLNIPAAGPFPVVVRGYYGSIDCDVSNNSTNGLALGFKDFVMPQGASQATALTRSQASTGYSCIVDRVADMYYQSSCQASNYYYCPATSSVSTELCTTGQSEAISSIVSPSAKKLKLLLTSSGADICQGLRNTETFAGGNGEPNSPFIICTANQLNNISNIYTSHDFRLAKNIDMNLSTNANCKDKAMNFNPIGGLYTPSGSTSCLPANTSYSPFTGKFYGEGNMISNIIINAEDSDEYIGFMRSADTNAEVRRLILNNVRVSGGNYVGALFGEGNGVLLNDIELKNSEIEGRENVGGIGGRINNGVTTKIKVVDTIVESKNGAVGGVFGYLGSPIDEVSFSGTVESYNSPNLGGIAGLTVPGATISKSASHGLILSDRSLNVGGIVGTSTDSLENVYSTMVISHKANQYGPDNVGGIVGNLAGSNIASKMLFLGSIGHDCISGTCYIGSIAGQKDPSATIDESFSFQDYTVSNGVEGVAQPYASFRSASTMNTMTSTWSASWVTPGVPSIWTLVEGDFPRLSFETQTLCQHPSNLLSVTNQISTLVRGTVTNPIVLCTREHLRTLRENITIAGRHFVLGDNISGGDNWRDVMPGLPGSPPNSFSSILDGKNKIIHDIHDNRDHDANSTGFIGNLDGVIKNTIFANIHFDNQSAGASAQRIAVVAATLSGKVEKVDIHGSSAKGKTMVGLVGGLVTGVIQDVYAQGVVKGDSRVGGIMGHSTAAATNLTRVHSDATIYPLTTSNTGTKFGGVAGDFAAGTMNQVEFSGRLETKTNPNSTVVGGLAGFNGGTINNALLSPHAQIESNHKGALGGIVGQNNGSVSNSIALGTILFDLHTIGTCSVGGYYDQMSCTASSGVWTYGIDNGNDGFCSSDLYTDQTNCETNGKDWYWKPNVDVGPIVGKHIAGTVSKVYGNSYPTWRAQQTSSAILQTCTDDPMNENRPTLAFPSSLGLRTGLSDIGAAVRDYHQNYQVVSFVDDATVATDSKPCSGFLISEPYNLHYTYVGHSILGTNYSDLINIDFFCPGISGQTAPNFSCASATAIDIIPDYTLTSPGRKRIYDAYLSEVTKTPLPISAPIWVMEEEYPKLYFAW